MKKQCEVCGKEFSKGRNISQKTWETQTKYCSKECQRIGVGKIAGPRFVKLNKSRVGIPMSDETKRKKSAAISRAWYLRNKERLSIESREKYLSESLDKKERRKILIEARDKMPGTREKRLLYYKNYRQINLERLKVYSKTTVSKYKTYNTSAKRRGYDFTLTFEEFKNTFHSACAYCGEKNSRGIDRIDNKKGYTVENSVPCCEMCNKMKWIWTEEEFKSRIKKIYNNLF